MIIGVKMFISHKKRLSFWWRIQFIALSSPGQDLFDRLVDKLLSARQVGSESLLELPSNALLCQGLQIRTVRQANVADLRFKLTIGDITTA